MKPKGTFTVIELGPDSYRVTGTKTDGERVRKNFSGAHAEAKAKDEKRALETEAFNEQERLCSTWLTPEQLQGAETAYGKVKEPAELLQAVDYWRDHGKDVAVAGCPTIEKAAKAFEDWLETNGRLRDRTKDNLRVRVSTFADSFSDYTVADVTPEHIQKFLDDRKVTAATMDNDKRAISRFFTWCKERSRRWIKSNPCREIHIERGEPKPPAILTVAECEKLMREAEKYKEGRLVPFVTLCLFAGLRPASEAMRLTWAQINLTDKEIRIEGDQSKTTGRARVFELVPTLRGQGKPHSGPDTIIQWLTACKGKPLFPPNWRRDFDAIKLVIGYGEGEKLKPWPIDVMRHTAISHYIRLTGSYGQAAEQFGNSEAIIKKNYQGRVTSEDTKAFYVILPTRKRKSRKIIDLPKPAAQPEANTKVLLARP